MHLLHGAAMANPTGNANLPGEISLSTTEWDYAPWLHAFRRVVSLPDDVDPDQVEANYRDGVLQIHIKRREAARPRQIKVKAT